MTEIIVTKFGNVAVSTYTREEFKKRAVKNLVSDIYKNLIDFNDDIIVISKVKSKEEYSVSDVLNEFFNTHDEYKDKLIFSQAGILTAMKVSSKISEGMKEVKQEKDQLVLSNFVNVIWNRRMAEVYENGDYYIYNNSIGKKFIEDNLGDNDSKIINRVSE